MAPILIVIDGLKGTGKKTLAQALAQELKLSAESIAVGVNDVSRFPDARVKMLLYASFPDRVARHRFANGGRNSIETILQELKAEEGDLHLDPAAYDDVLNTTGQAPKQVLKDALRVCRTKLGAVAST